MFTLDVDRFTFELKDGSLKNVGGADKSATAKLYDVEDVEVRAFGDKRVKLAFADGEGNEVEIALFPGDAREVVEGVERLEEDSPVFE